MQNNTPEAHRLLQEHLASPRGLFKLSANTAEPRLGCSPTTGSRMSAAY
jgi:hypothetical protein